ncbi:MAG TPA: type II toxin-antitoxin system VapC family toxin [Gemmatimonadales bacterium]
MIAYVESSAVLAWILGEPAGTTVRRLLAKAERVVSSTLTAVECDRAINRGTATGQLSDTQRLAALQLLDAAANSWTTVEMTGIVLQRARQSFPHEPVRTLDAIHLSTAIHVRQAFPDLVVVSLDTRVRENASALAMTVAPPR